MKKQIAFFWISLIAIGTTIVYVGPVKAIAYGYLGIVAYAAFTFIVGMLLIAALVSIVSIFKFLAALPSSRESMRQLVKRISKETREMGYSIKEGETMQL